MPYHVPSLATRRQAIYPGLSAMGAALTRASAPRIGVPGPGWPGLLGVGGGAFGQGYQGYLRADQARQAAALQAQLAQQKLAEGRAEAAARARGYDRNRLWAEKYPSLRQYFDLGPPPQPGALAPVRRISPDPTIPGAAVLSAMPPAGPFSLPAPGGPPIGTAQPPVAPVATPEAVPEVRPYPWAGQFGARTPLPSGIVRRAATPTPTSEIYAEFDKMGVGAVAGLAENMKGTFIGGMAEQYVKTHPDRPQLPSDIGSQAQFRLKDGTEVRGFFDKGSRRWRYWDPEGEEQNLPFGVKRITPTSTGRELMKPTAIHKMRQGMMDTQTGLRQIVRYMKNVAETGAGFKSIAAQWRAKFKVISGEDLTQENIAALMQKGQLQGLLGKFRKEIVGGGVMTEQDALRILSALGGEVTVARHPEIVRLLLGDIVRAKIRMFNEVDLPMFNDQARRTRIYKAIKPLEVPPIFSDTLGTGGARTTETITPGSPPPGSVVVPPPR